MPTIRCTHRFLKLLGQEAVRAAREDDSEESDLDWYANLFWVEGRKCLIFVNAGTLFPVVALDVLKDDFRDPGALLRDRYKKVLVHLKAPTNDAGRELSLLQDLRIGKTRHRTILGSMTQLVKDAQMMIEYGGGLDGIRDEHFSANLAETPMTGLLQGFPIDELRKRIPGIPDEIRKESSLFGDKGPSRVLQSFFYRPGARDVAFRYHEMLGFMFYMVTAPEFIDPLGWFLMMLGGDDAPFHGLDDANAVIQEVIHEYNRVVLDVQGGLGFDFEYVPFRDDPVDEFGELVPLHEWALGFAGAFRWVPELWDGIPEDAHEIVAAAMGDLVFFTSKENAREHMAFAGDPDGDLHEFANRVRSRLSDSSRVLAEIGQTYRRRPEMPGVSSPSGDGAAGLPPKVGRNEPCPCGSGKKYKHCCGSEVRGQRSDPS